MDGEDLGRQPLEAVAVERDSSRTPVFQTMFTWEEAQGWGEIGERLSGLRAVSADDNAVRTAKFEVELGLGSGADGGLVGSIVFNTDVYDQSTIARMAKHLRTQLVPLPL